MPQKSANTSPHVAAPPTKRFQAPRAPAVTASPSRSSPRVSQGSKGRPTRSANAPTVSRTPLIRAPQSAASEIPRGKAPPGVFPSQSSGFRPPSQPFRSVDRRSGDRTIHGNDGHDRRLVHIGVDRDHAHQARGPYNHAYTNHGHRSYHPYGYGHYYHNYRPIYYPGCDTYYPYLGYSFASAYFSTPYVVQVYNDSPGYGYSTYTPEQTPAPVVQASPPAVSPPLSTGEPYQPLSTPQTQTSVDEGNAAFAAGRYEEAGRFYVRAVMADERDGYAKMLYAWANFALGDYEVAAASLRRALLTTPDLVDYPLDLRTLYPDRAVLDRHADALMRFIAEHPQHREAQLLWGYLLYSIGQAEPAASVFTSLAGTDQNDTLSSLLRDAAVRNARSTTPPPDAP